jgi:hypothetical protein
LQEENEFAWEYSLRATFNYFRNGNLWNNNNVVTLKLCIPNTAHLFALQPTTRGAGLLFDTQTITWYDSNVQSWICVIWSLKCDKQVTRGAGQLFDTQTLT